MRISIDGQHIISGVQGVYLDGQEVMPNGGLAQGAWDFFTSSILGYGGFNAVPGLYTTSLIPPFHLTDLGPHGVAGAEAFWTDGVSRWLGLYSFGSADSSGQGWPDRAAAGSSRQGDWLFFQKPGFNQLVVRSAAGVEHIYDTGPINAVAMDDGVILYANTGSPTAIGAVTPNVPRFMRFVHHTDGDWYLAGYAPGWGLCLARWDLAPKGWLLSGDGQDFAPVIASLGQRLVVASGVNQGEFPQRRYVIDPVLEMATLNGGSPWSLQRIDLFDAPVTIPPFTHPVYVAPFFPTP